MFYCHTYSSPIGELTLSSDGENLTGLRIAGQKHFSRSRIDPVFNPSLPVFQKTVRWLDGYFSGNAPSAAILPLKPDGSDFRQQVWRILLQIPWGQTLTYGQIAQMLNKPKAAQAVGGAVGHNPIAIIIPCHRVLGADGSLTGYAGGTDNKLWLLRHEGILPHEENRKEFPSIYL